MITIDLAAVAQLLAAGGIVVAELCGWLGD